MQAQLGSTVEVFRRVPAVGAAPIAGPEWGRITHIVSAACVDVELEDGTTHPSLDYWDGEGEPPAMGTYCRGVEETEEGDGEPDDDTLDLDGDEGEGE